MEVKKLMSLQEAVKYLGVSKWTLRKWDNEGKLKAIRNTMNNYRMYRKEDLDKVYNVNKESEEGL